MQCGRSRGGVDLPDSSTSEQGHKNERFYSNVPVSCPQSPGTSGDYGDSYGGRGCLILVSDHWLTAMGLCCGLSGSSAISQS